MEEVALERARCCVDCPGLFSLLALCVRCLDPHLFSTGRALLGQLPFCGPGGWFVESLEELEKLPSAEGQLPQTGVSGGALWVGSLTPGQSCIPLLLLPLSVCQVGSRVLFSRWEMFNEEVPILLAQVPPEAQCRSSAGSTDLLHSC